MCFGDEDMPGRLDIDQIHSRAIAQEIGERLPALMGKEAELPLSLRRQIERLRELDGQSPPIVPTEEENLSNNSGHHDGGRRDQPQPASSWWRKGWFRSARMR